MKKNVVEEYSNNARNMTERNMKRKYGEKNLFKSNSVQTRTAEEVLAEWCYGSLVNS